MGLPRKKPKNPPVMSHEFVIQNHADILACFAVVIAMGMISESTAKISKLFIFLQYGIMEEITEESESKDEPEKLPTEFGRGIFDIFIISFMALMLIVVQAVIQEYIVDKMSRKLHLSKTKNSKFSESCQLLVWYVVSVAWSARLLVKNGFLQNISSLWEGYPHSILSWETKLYLLLQIAYWVHMYPELYFQKARKEEIPNRIQYYTLNLIFISMAYMLQFWRIGMMISVMHFAAEGIFHASRILYFSEKSEISKTGFAIWGILFPIVRLLILALTFLVFWFGFGRAAEQGIDLSTGNFNSFFIRMTCISSLCLLQVWLMWPFIQLRLKKVREEKQERKKLAAISTSKPKQKKSQKKATEEAADNGVTTRSSGKLKKN